MISNFSTPSIASSGTGAKSDKTIMIVSLLLVGVLIYKFVIKPEMDKQKIVVNENSSNGEFE
jgi:hypothetical protein